MGIYKKLAQIQYELNVPKGRDIFLKKGKFSYRKYEDIIKALKPLLNKYQACLLMSDEIEAVAPDRVYIKTTLKLVDIETEEYVESTAFAREDSLSQETQEGVTPKTTLSVSSYARKSALIALFCIDDGDEERTWDGDNANNKNSIDSDNKSNVSSIKEKETVEKIEQEFSEMNREQIINIIYQEMKQKNISLHEVCSKFQVEKIENLCLNSLARIYFALYKAEQKK